MVSITHATSETSKTNSKNATFRLACFTIYADVDMEIPKDLDWPKLSKHLRFLAYGNEICPKSKRPHLQCYAYAHTPMRLTQWLQVLGPKKHHIEAMKGSLASNERYCSKEGELKKFGIEPSQGQRTDLIAVKRLIDGGKRPMEIADEHEEHFGTVMKFDRALKSYDRYKRAKKFQDDRTKPEVYIRWGPPGSGKTRWLDINYGLDGWRFAPSNKGLWFDGCSDRDVVCFDDVKINEVPPLGLLLQLTHEYPVQVKVHGDYDTWKPRVIVFTSNYPPDQWWDISTDDPNYKAFMRRVTRIDKVVYKKPENHGDQAKANQDQDQETDLQS